MAPPPVFPVEKKVTVSRSRRCLRGKLIAATRINGRRRGPAYRPAAARARNADAGVGSIGRLAEVVWSCRMSPGSAVCRAQAMLVCGVPAALSA